MNKKFSTLVATLLLAGAWTTANAELIKVTPQAGGVYLIGTAVDEVAEKVTDCLNTSTLYSTNGASAVISSMGEAWILTPTTTTDGKNCFYLTAADGTYAGQHLSFVLANSASGYTGYSNESSAQPIKFVFENDKLVVAENTSAGAGFVKGHELVLTANGRVTVTNTGQPTLVGTKVAFAVWNNDVTVLASECELQSSINKDEYYLISDGTNFLLGDANGNATITSAASTITETNVDEYLWKVSSETVGTTVKYIFTNKKTGKKAVVGSDNSFAASNIYSGSFDLEGLAAGTKASGVGIYKSPIVKANATDLNDLLGEGFGINIKVADGVTLNGTSALSGKLKAEAISTTNDKLFQLKSGKSTLALTVSNEWEVAEVGANARGGKFVLLTADEIAKITDFDKKYMTWFSISQYAGLGDETVDVISVTNNLTGADAQTRNMFVMALSAKNSILTGTKALVGDEKYPTITLGLSNVADVKQFLGEFWNISFAATKEEAKEAGLEEYKVGRVLAIEDYQAEYVTASSVEASFPEAQWAVTAADLDNNSFTLTNRESQTTIKNVILRETDEDNVYVVETAYYTYTPSYPVGSTPQIGYYNLEAGDKIKMTKVTKYAPEDGYLNVSVNALRNQKYYMGQYHAIAGNKNVYFSENHSDSHKLGVVTDRENDATVWNLEYKMKTATGKENEVDTVFVETEFATLKDGKILPAGDKDAKTSTLAILPFQFKNRNNGEYVAYNSGKAYECYTLGLNDQKKGNTKAGADEFALKFQPNGTYNIVSLGDNDVTKDGDMYLGGSKIQVANSEIDGFGELVNESMYAKDDNTLMVVEPIETPEYRKITAAWGDTISIFRDDNNSQVLYEKGDPKSVVENDTLSFLNIDNMNQFAGIAPAMFVDTAYVNRVDENEEVNTRYQYLLAVNVDKVLDTYCPENMEHNDPEWIAEHGVCPHAIKTPVVHARYLVNMIDTANVYGKIHNNPYIIENEAGEDRAKLSFVQGFHVADSLYFIRNNGDTVKHELGTPDFNVAKFAFRYVDNEKKSFKIQTLWKEYAPTEKEEDREVSEEGYLKWINGTVVVEKGWDKGDVFNMDEDFAGNPTANEEVAISGISVIAGNGFVTIKGAAGKNVVITNVLGQQVANTVIASNEAQISAPAGIVVVAVEGEAAVKAIVK